MQRDFVHVVEADIAFLSVGVVAFEAVEIQYIGDIGRHLDIGVSGRHGEPGQCCSQREVAQNGFWF